MSLWETLFGGQKQPPPPSRPREGEQPNPNVGDGEAPYGIAGRPMPSGENVNVLLPGQVGTYVREPIKLPGKGMPIYGNYRSSAATVFVELGICDSPHDAEMALETAKDETGANPQVYFKRQDLWCCKTVNADGAFMAWTRGRYYFSAHAKGGERDLDEFMGAFPY